MRNPRRPEIREMGQISPWRRTLAVFASTFLLALPGCSGGDEASDAESDGAAGAIQGLGGSGAGLGGASSGGAVAAGGTAPAVGGGDLGLGGAAVGAGGAAPGVGGADPGLGGADPGLGGADPGVGGAATGGFAGSPGVGGDVGVGGTGAGGGGGAPGALSAIPANGTIGLEWPVTPGATSYNLYWSTTADVSPTTGTLIAGAERGYVHRDTSNGQTYYYVVTAVVDGSESAPSDVASATPGGEWVLEQLGTGDFTDVVTGAPVPTVPVEQRVHILLFGEGYLASELYKLHDHTDHSGARDNDVDRWIDLVFSIEPYSLFPEAFVIWYLPRASNTTIRDPNPDTAFQVPVDVSSFAQMGSVPTDGATAQIAWAAIDDHLFPPADFTGPAFRRARNAVAAFLIFDPDYDQASVSGLATSLQNPADANQRIAAAFGVGHAHEFTHSFANVRDEYMETSNSAPSSWSGTSNVVGTNVCGDLPWSHLLYGSTINPSVDGLVGAFGDPSLGYHSELLCLMNGTHDNGEFYGTSTGSCSPTSCTLRSEDRMCNYCRETTALRVFQRTGILPVDDDTAVAEWAASYRTPFYAQYEFRVPGVHFPGLVPQSNDRRDPETSDAERQIYQACVP